MFLRRNKYSGPARKCSVSAIKYRLITVIISFCIMFTACSDQITLAPGMDSYSENGVSILDRGNYFQVTMDYTGGIQPEQMGESLAKCILKVVPDYEGLVDSYLTELINSNRIYGYILSRVSDIRNQMPEEYKEEIDGIASVISTTKNSVRSDNKLSKEEIFLFNLIPDTYRATMCSAISVFGSRSATGSTITGRALDWYGGESNQLPRIQCITTIRYKDKSMYQIGYLGFMGVITGFNDSKVFAAVMDSGTGDVYSSQGKRSYTMDLRYALENTSTLDGAANYMKDPSRYYAFNHDIFLSDPNISKVLENNFTIGTNEHRAVRESDSQLNNGIKWGISDAIGCVNSFMLKGSYDNHTTRKYNTKRWDNMKKMLLKEGSKVSCGGIKRIISYDAGSPGTFVDSGDLYNKTTQQIIIFQPKNLSLEIFFHPKTTRELPDTSTFEKVNID